MRPSDSQYADRIRLDDESGCWTWTGMVSVNGRALISVHQKSRYAYRIIWEELVGPIPDGLLCCHHCDNPVCVNPEHIFLGTAKDNAQDAARKGRLKEIPKVKGIDHPRSADVPDDVIDQVRREYAGGGVTQAQLAVRYGVGPSTVGRWLRREARDSGNAPAVSGAVARSARLQPCGTRAGYIRHRHHGEAACPPCKAANTAYLRDYKAKRRAGVPS